MKLLSVRIQNFKSIHDSEKFSIDQVTCLVGKNEAGKTAILQSLTKLKPVEGNNADFTELEFPRMTYHEYSDKNRPKDVLITNWELEDEDVKLLEKSLGKDTILSNQVILKKGYLNKLEWDIEIDYRSIVHTYINGAGLYAEEKKRLANISNTTGLFKALNEISSPSEREVKLLADLKVAFPKGGAKSTADEILEECLPNFLYFPVYELMRGEVSLQQISQKQSSDNLSMSDRIFLALLEMAGTDIKTIDTISRFEPLIAKLEAISNRLTREIFRYWSQNKHLSVDFRFDAARPQDSPPFNQGYIFRTRIENTRHGVTVPFDERSTGFVWFFSFLVWFSQVRNNYGENLIILLDEPGLSLHAKAQSDLLRYIKEKLAPHYQVLYTTHSPFMIDPENLIGVRTVEDITKDEEVLGTKVSEDVLSTDKDTLFPLQAALGYEIAQTLFVGEHVVLVEGPSDLLYIRWASDLLKRRKRTYLDNRWVVTPAGSIDKIASFVALFGGKGIHIATLTDFAHGDKSKVQRLRENALLKAGHVLTVNNYAKQNEADIEDVLGRDFYITLISKCYKLTKTNSLPKSQPKNAPIRVVKEAEQHFAKLPATVAEFDHYTPAVFLIENSAALASELPGIEEALDRFEVIFTDLNQLLP